jgi:hypothetical protein
MVVDEGHIFDGYVSSGGSVVENVLCLPFLRRYTDVVLVESVVVLV